MITKLQELKVQAMKNRDAIAKNILSLLHSDSLNLAKKETRPLTDEDIVNSAKTIIKRNKQAIADVEKGHGDHSALNTEIEILLKFLPAQKSEEEIKAIIDKIIDLIPTEERIRKIQGKIMKQIKDEYGNAIDMAIAAKYLGGKLS